MFSKTALGIQKFRCYMAVAVVWRLFSKTALGIQKISCYMETAVVRRLNV